MIADGRKDNLMQFFNFFRTNILPCTILRCACAFIYKWLDFVSGEDMPRIVCAILIVGGYFYAASLSDAADSGTDRLVETIDKMKQSVGPVICIRPGGIQVNGSGFFLDEHGTFLTAGHVIREFLPSGALHNCAQADIYFPVEKWVRGPQQVIGFR